MSKRTLTEFVGTKLGEELGAINTCLICKIIAVDMNYLRADVVPLSGDATPILDVPIAFHQTSKFIIQMPYEIGDIVFVGCSQVDIDPILYGGGDAASRVFDQNDAVIIGGINLFTSPIENQHPNDVVIGTKDMKTKIVLTENAEILIKSQKLTFEADDIQLNGGNIALTGGSITANGEDLSTDLV